MERVPFNPSLLAALGLVGGFAAARYTGRRAGATWGLCVRPCVRGVCPPGAMAGGRRTGRGLTLAERAALSGVVPDRPAGRGGRRHCWVAAPAPDENPCPGLVLDWQRVG